MRNSRLKANKMKRRMGKGMGKESDNEEGKIRIEAYAYDPQLAGPPPPTPHTGRDPSSAPGVPPYSLCLPDGRRRGQGAEQLGLRDPEDPGVAGPLPQPQDVPLRPTQGLVDVGGPGARGRRGSAGRRRLGSSWCTRG